MPIQFEPIEVQVDEIEINTWTTCNSTQTQLIYKRFRYGRMCVVGWKIGTAEEIIEDSSGFVVKHRQYRIRADKVRQTSSTYDAERREFSRFGYGERVQELCGGWGS